MATKAKKTFSSENLNLVFATLGWLVAVGSLYFQFFYVKNEITATLTSMEMGQTKVSKKKIPNLIKLSFVFQNSGNTTYTILEQKTILVADTNELSLDRYVQKDPLFEYIKVPFISNNTYGNSKDTPVIIKGGEHIFETFYSFLDIENDLTYQTEYFYGLFKTKSRLADTIRVFSNFTVLSPSGKIGERTVEVGWFKPNDEEELFSVSSEIQSYQMNYTPLKISEFDYEISNKQGKKSTSSIWDLFKKRGP